MKSFFISLLFILCCVLVGGAIFILSGVYNMGADVPHWKATFLLLDVARERSVSFHSNDIEPLSLGDPKLVERGFPHYHETCRLCHGAPGVHREEIARGLYPNPPLLNSNEVQQELVDSELFWIVKHGLKMTGMPSFGQTHTDEQIRNIVIFVRHLPVLGPKDYLSMVKAHEQDSPGEQEHHGKETME